MRAVVQQCIFRQDALQGLLTLHERVIAQVFVVEIEQIEVPELQTDLAAAS